MMWIRLFVFLVFAAILLPGVDGLEEGWNTITPGGETICARGTDFKFFVRPADTENIMIYFQGGGACWNDFTCAPGGTFDDSIGTPEEEIGRYAGIFDYTNEENPLADYTAVFIPYCTADVHIGDAVTEYADGNITIHHNGVKNARAVLDWLYENYENPDTIFITGSSAGAYGSIYHASSVIEHYPDANIIQFGDGGVGVTPAGWRVLEQWGTYDNIPEFVEADPETFTTNTLYRANVETYPDARFSQYTTAADDVQIRFYRLAGATSAWDAVMQANLEELAAYSNFRSYVAGGSLHTILAQPVFYTYAVGGVRIRDWLAYLLNGDDVESLACEECSEPELIESK